MGEAENQCDLVNGMIRARIESSGETEAEAVQKILAQVANLPDDAPMIVAPGGGKVDARTIRVWASFYCTPNSPWCN